MESFLDSSLEGLPKDVLITDGASMYQKIIDKMGIKHQLCIFHVLKNHHESLFRSIRRLARRIRTIDNQQWQKKESIKKLDNELKQENLPAKKKTKKRNKIKQLNDEIRELRKERREKKAKLKELMNTNERVENIYKADDKKGANRRFNTLYNGRKFLNRHSGSYLENLGKKLDRTLTFYDDPLIPKTNNGIERYFGITLPSNLKRKFRTTGGLTRWLRLQKIKWTRRNVLHNYEVENLSLTDYLQEKII